MKETKHGIFNVNLEEYYSLDNEIVYYNWRVLLAGPTGKWRRVKTDFKKLPEVNYQYQEEKNKTVGIDHAIGILEEERDRIYKL